MCFFTVIEYKDYNSWLLDFGEFKYTYGKDLAFFYSRLKLLDLLSSVCFNPVYHSHFVLQTAKQFHDHPEKRTPIAMEVLSSEVEYNRVLQAVKDVYVKPLRAALNSNR